MKAEDEGQLGVSCRMDFPPIAVGYQKALGLLMLACALFILGVAFLTGKLFPQAITGGILLAVSFGYLTQPALVISPGVVETKNLFGITLKTHRFASLRDLVLDDKGLQVAGERVKLTRWILSGGDLARLAQAVQSDRA